MLLGSHVSMSKGLIGAAKEAYSYGADTFMIYTGAPQNTRRKPIDQLKIEEGRAFMAEHKMSGPVVHAPYIINMASYKDATYTLAIDFFKEEILRAETIGADYIVVHPGAYTDKDVDYGIQRIADALNQILTPETRITVCLETMAGKGTEIGRSFEELQQIIEKVTLQEKSAYVLTPVIPMIVAMILFMILKAFFNPLIKSLVLTDLKCFTLTVL